MPAGDCSLLAREELRTPDDRDAGASRQTILNTCGGRCAGRQKRGRRRSGVDGWGWPLPVRLLVAHLLVVAWWGFCLHATPARAQVLQPRVEFERQQFWDNRDWEWFESQIPLFDCPDPNLVTTWYYRWELLTKHLTYGSPNTGYTFTEFIDRPFWSGAYGAISCPAGHQLYEARWLRSPRIARDYLRYWFRTPGAQPRNYSTWLADSAWAVHLVHPHEPWLVDLLPDLVRHYEGWEARHFVPEVGLFWQTGHDDGMEFNINSRQTRDILRGAPSFRPSFNAYMWADAQAIARIAGLAGQADLAARYRGKADRLKERLQTLLWDPQRQFFFPMYRDDEERDGHKVRARTLTYQTGQFAGSEYGRELIGYVPWQFELPDSDRGFEAAWARLTEREGFWADYGPTTVERRDPMFLLQKSCCWWSGQSWPYATTQTLKGLANLLQTRTQSAVTREHYLQLLQIYSQTHRKEGRPYLAEAAHPDTGSFEGHDGYNHSEHYFHSGFTDLVITGLVGVRPQPGGRIGLHPLAPPEWSHFALDSLALGGQRVTILWDRDGQRYGRGAGLLVLVNDRVAARADSLEPLEFTLPPPGPAEPLSAAVEVNYAVNNDGTYYPRVTATHVAAGTSLDKVQDGNLWYLQHPPNRFSFVGSRQPTDRLEVDLGTERWIDRVKLFLLDDTGLPNAQIAPPTRIEAEEWREQAWHPLPVGAEALSKPVGHRPTTLSFEPRPISRLRFTFHHALPQFTGLTEVEVWGAARLPVETAPPPAGNLAYNPGDREFPKATATFTDRFGGKPQSALDGKTIFLPTPMNRWTSYESKELRDWLEIDFGKPTEFRRVELAIYDDRGGVQPPRSYRVEYETDGGWEGVRETSRQPEKPTGGTWNEVRCEPVRSSRLRIVFEHAHPARSGVTEVQVWNE